MKSLRLRLADPQRREALVTALVYLLAVLPALYGLPLGPGARIHHYILLCPIAVAVVITNVRWARRAMLRPRAVGPWASLVLPTLIALFLYTSGFHAVIADHYAGFDFIATLIGVESGSVRTGLVLLVAIFALVLNVAFAAKEQAADAGPPVSTSADGTPTRTARSAFRDAAERVTVKSSGNRKTTAAHHRGVNDNQRDQSAPSSARANLDPAETTAPAGSDPSAPEPAPAPPMAEDIWSGTAQPHQPLAERHSRSRIVWVVLCLLLGAFLALTWVWTGQGIADGACKPTVRDGTVQIARAPSLRRWPGGP
jgi:hypothetical protein